MSTTILGISIDTSNSSYHITLPNQQKVDKFIKLVNSTVYELQDASSTEEFVSWASKRIPNSAELKTTSIITAIGTIISVTGLAEIPLLKLATDPDIQKAASAFVSAQLKHESGSTGIIHDEGHTYGFGWKALCNNIIKDDLLGSTAKLFFCEPGNRALANLANLRQSTNSTNISYGEFIKDKLDLGMLIQASSESVGKTVTTNVLDWTSGAIGSSVYNIVTFNALKYIVGKGFNLNAADNLAQKWSGLQAQGLAPKQIVTVLAPDVITTLAAGPAYNLISTSLSRIVQDLVGPAAKTAHKLWNKAEEMLAKEIGPKQADKIFDTLENIAEEVYSDVITNGTASNITIVDEIAQSIIKAVDSAEAQLGKVIGDDNAAKILSAIEVGMETFHDNLINNTNSTSPYDHSENVESIIPQSTDEGSTHSGDEL